MTEHTVKKKLLELKNIRKSFPGVQALAGVDFEVEEGEVHVLLGENGAGKSTLVKIISGVYQKDTGDIFIQGKAVEIRSPKASLDFGISVIYQELDLIKQIDVAKNIFLGRNPLRKGFLGRFLHFVNYSEMYDQTSAILQELDASIDSKTIVRELSASQQQIVAIARALSMKSRVILMDEPTSSLGRDEKRRLFDIILTLKEKGIGIVYISHILEDVFEIGDRVTVLRDGAKIATRDISHVKVDDLIQMMVGRTFKERYPAISGKIEKEIVLEVRNLSLTGVFNNINFKITKGEILGFAGLVGAKRTDLAKTIFGIEKFDSGEILVQGRPLSKYSSKQAIQAGLAFLPEDRRNEGIFGIMSVHDNILISSLNQRDVSASKKLVLLKKLISFRHTRSLCEEFIKALDIKAPSLDTSLRFLSGGNQQKVLLARWLCTNARLIILDEPTRGIDPGSKIEFYLILEQLAKNGVAIIVISSELQEVSSICNRILVMRLGEITGEFLREEATEEAIMKCAALKKMV